MQPMGWNMTRVEIEISDALHDWATRVSTHYGLSFGAYIEVLLALESGLARTSRDGRLLRCRSFIYRGDEMYFVPDAEEAAARA